MFPDCLEQVEALGHKKEVQVMFYVHWAPCELAMLRSYSDRL